MNQANRKLIIAMQIAFVVLSAVFVFFHILDKILTERPGNFDSAFYELTDWHRIHEDGTEEPLIFPTRVDAEKGDTVKVKTILPDNLRDDYYLAFYNSRDCRIYVDSELRFVFDADSADVWGGICSRRWFFIPITSADAGKTVTIFRYDTSTINTVFYNVYYGDAHGISQGYKAMHRLYYYCAILLGAIATAVAMIGAVMHGIFKHKIEIIEMAIGILMAALWLVFDSPSFQLTFNNYYINGPLAYMAVLLMPYPIICYINDVQKRRYEKYNVSMMIASLTVTFVLFFLHLTGISSFEHNVIVITLLQTVLIVCIIYIIMLDISRGHLAEYSIIATGTLIFLMLTSVEVFLLITMQGRIDRTFLLVGLYTLMFSGLLQQIIEIRNSEQEKKAAIEANLQKSSFLANMSHEIRTPINSIIGMNEIILRENTNPEIADYARQIDSSGRLLLGLINDVLDFSKIEAGKLEIIPGKFSTIEFANDIVVMASERAKHKNIEIVFNISESLPSVLIGDDLHIKQVIINLISNAVKYTKEGTVTFTMGVMPSFTDEKVCDIKFTVQDTGVGIKKENIDKLFDSFTRVDEKKNRSIEGTGLGLSIVRNLVDMMHGTVSVESEYGKGSTFTVILPLEVGDKTPIGNFSEAVSHFSEKTEKYIETFHAPDAKILVVDDNAVNLRVVRELLKNTQVELDMADNGKDAVSLCAGKKYHLILMDHRMPDPDGIETLHMIREDRHGLNNTTPAVVLTANAFAGLKEKYIEEGFADYLTKPIDSKILEKTVMELLPKDLVITELEPLDRTSPESSDKSTEPAGTVGDADRETVRYSKEKGGNKMSFADAMRNVAGMDYDATSEQYGGGEEFMQSLLETVVEDGREKIELMYKYLEEKDYENYGIEAHAAKSTMATINAMDISAHAKKHEFAAKENNIDFILADSKAFLEEYAEMLNRIDEAMKNAE